VELGLSGWVRNLVDGRVEAEFVGTRAAVEAAIAFVHEGPPHARVDGVEGFVIENSEPSSPSAEGGETGRGSFLVL